MQLSSEIEDDFKRIIVGCRSVYVEKLADYGPTWLLVRFPSLIDELWRKIKRIRTLEENGDNNLVPEGRNVEYIGLINYSIIALIRLTFGDSLPSEDEVFSDKGSISTGKLGELYDNIAQNALELLMQKNHDYGNAWREMEPSSLTDQVVVKVYRIKTILRNSGKTRVSEGMDAQLYDIINYCVFSLVRLDGEG